MCGTEDWLLSERLRGPLSPAGNWCGCQKGVLEGVTSGCIYKDRRELAGEEVETDIQAEM